jgi:hypothetical protein
MAKTNWMAKLATLEGAVTERRNIHSTVIQTASPYLNFTFGHGWGLPLGHSLVLYGPPKAGKSILSYVMAAGVHRDYEDGIVVKFNTEFREEGQLDPKLAATLGIDMNRYMGIDANAPDLIYDQIEKQLAAWCGDGMPIKLVIIDSMNGVQGRRGMESDSILKTQIGDVALTNKEGLKRVLPVQRKYNFSVIMTSHVAIEMDPIEQKRGNKYKMGASIGVQHHAEYFMFVERDVTKAGRMDLLEREFVDASVTDAADKGEVTGNKIRFVLKDSSFGCRGRHGVLTFDYGRGVINQHEDVFLLGTQRGVVERPDNTHYVFDGKKWKGKPAFLAALKDDKQMQEAILKELRTRDMNGQMAQYDAQDAKEYASDEAA